MKLFELFGPFKVVAAKHDIDVGEFGRQQVLYLSSGFCIGCDMLADGRRQIISIYLPGDFINVTALRRKQRGQQVTALTDSSVGAMTPAQLRRLVDEDDALRATILTDMLRRQAIHEVWISALGRKSATERMSLFFCELFCRMTMADRVVGNAFHVPLNQIELSDVLGISVVHVNRCLKYLRDASLVTFDAGRVEILDFEKLAGIAEFDGDYLK